MIPTNELLFIDKENKKVTCLVDELVIHIPEKYKNFGCLTIEEVIYTLGIFEMFYKNESIGGLLLSSIIQMEPSDSIIKNIDGTSYLILTFNKDDVFIANTNVVQVPIFSYYLFNEFMALGNLPNFLQYQDLALLFDYISQVCGVNFKSNHAVFEMMYAYLSRDPNDLNLQYRLSEMKEPSSFIKLNSVTYGPDSTTAKLSGAYLNDGLNSALIYPSTKRSKLEDLMRT